MIHLHADDAVPTNRFTARDPRAARLIAVVARVEGATRRLAHLATRAAIAGGVGGLALWWSTSGRRIHDVGQDTAVSLLVLGLCLVPAGWLLNVRLALLALLELPARLAEVTMRRGSQLVGPARDKRPVPEHRPGTMAAVRSLRSVARDYGEVVGSWAAVAQIVTPTFWALTAVALLAVPILVTVGTVAALVALLD